MKKILTLCIVHNHPRVLLGMKKRGTGSGYWNGFGGKVEEGETIESAAAREVTEESGVTIESMEKMGVLNFTLPGEEKVWQTHVFRAMDFIGTPQETEEMKPQWFDVSEIPFDTMWADDKYWFPLFLEGKKFVGSFLFDSEGKNIVEQELKEVETL